MLPERRMSEQFSFCCERDCMRTSGKLFVQFFYIRWQIKQLTVANLMLNTDR